MKISLFYLPSVGNKAQVEQGMVGLRGDLYDQMLREVSAQARLADDLGYDSISFTEHHFHVEGFELSNNPVLLDLYIGMQTKRLRVGQLGIVLPANNPIRVAEDIAMLDHMTGGRANAGFARGYQRRWVDIMAQQTHGIHGAHAASARRDRRRQPCRVRGDASASSRAAWTQDMLSYQGKYWRMPPGETPWTIEATAKWGRGVENGIVKAVSVVPKPVQKPHPPIFQPFASSERSIRWCAQEGVTAVIPPLIPAFERQLCDVYADVSGRAPGEGMGVLRDVIIADTDEEAHAIWHESGYFCGREWFVPFGFCQGTGGSENRRDAGPVRERPCAGRHGRHRDPPGRTAAQAAAGLVDFCLDVQRTDGPRSADENDRTVRDQGSAAGGECRLKGKC